MSGKNGNGRISEHQKRVAELAGLKAGDVLPYAPDYLDSLAVRMATPDADWAERTFAWLLYRASGNHSTRGRNGIAAIHIYSRGGEKRVETELRQRDCCLDLAWLEAGHPAEWLDAPLTLFRREAAKRGIEPIDRRYVSEGFTENRERGTVASDTGHRLELVPSPFVIYSSDKQGENKAKTKGEPKAKSAAYRAFCKEWNVTHSSEYQDEQVARSTYKRIQKVRLSAYKLWRKSQTPEPNGAPSLESLESLETLEAAPAASPVPAVENHHHQSLIAKEEKPTKADDDEKPKPEPKPIPAKGEYANAREHLKAVYLAKTGEYAPVDLIDRIESTVVGQCRTLDEFVELLGPHLPNHWKNPGGFLTSKARTIFAPPTSPPQQKPKPKCPRCRADNGRGAILEGGKIIACPECSSPQWAAELAGQEEMRLNRKAATRAG